MAMDNISTIDDKILIAERTKESINTARLKGKIHGSHALDKGKLSSALKLNKTYNIFNQFNWTIA
jgi:hypothetical protein